MPSPTAQLLAEAERRASQGVVGAAACWADAALLQTVQEVLLPPSSNLQLAQWSRQPELLQVRRQGNYRVGCRGVGMLLACRTRQPTSMVEVNACRHSPGRMGRSACVHCCSWNCGSCVL